jgi:multisubunit Na+/H+ antiporter MnhB subunit
MEIILVLSFVAIFAVITYKMAESRGRNVWGYTIAGILVSPLIAWILLALLGKTPEKTKADILEMKKVMMEDETIMGQ